MTGNVQAHQPLRYPMGMGAWVAVCTLLWSATVPASGQDIGARRPTAEARVFDEDLEIEIALPPGQASAEALAAALREAVEIEALVDPDGDEPGGIGSLNRARGRVEIDHRLHAALQRALAFCVWSQQAHGPLGGTLYAAWGLRRSAGGRPDARFLEEQLPLAYCERLQLGTDVDPEGSSEGALANADRDDPRRFFAELAAGSRVDLWGFERGLAVDRMIDVLRQHGVTNGYVQLGEITRAIGPGPDDWNESVAPGGWVVAVHPGGDERIDQQFVVLRDQSLSLASRQVQTLVVDGEARAPYLDQRTGQLREGVLAVAAVAELALDAEALSVALFVMNQREGEFRLGALDPQPAARWYLGSGTGFPLISERRWSSLPKWQPSDNPFRERFERPP